MRPTTWTLRARLVMAMLGLTTLALTLVNVFGITLLRDNMVQRVDQQLTGLTKMSGQKIMAIRPWAPPVGELGAVLEKRLAAVVRIYVFGPEGDLVGALPRHHGPGPELGDVRYGTPYTVPGTDGPSWRVLATPADDGTTWVFAQSLADVEQT